MRLHYKIDEKSFNNRYAICGSSCRLLFSNFDDEIVKEKIQFSIDLLSNIEQLPSMIRGDIGNNGKGESHCYLIDHN